MRSTKSGITRATPGERGRKRARLLRAQVVEGQARLDHASASETLDTYAHLSPDNEERTRAAVDDVLGRTGTGDQKSG